MPPFLRPAALALMLAATPLAAEPDLSPLRRAELSARLYAAGQAAGDALLVLAAARLRKTIAPAPGGPAPAAPEAPEGGAPLDWRAMLDAAAALAPGDPLIAGLIEDTRAEADKGVLSGPIYGIAALSPGKADLYEHIDFRGGEYAEVYVEAKKPTDMQLYVEDDRGRLVCSDTDKSHIAYCGWRPAETGRFTLRVENRGRMRSDYALMTN
ncbi:hypothetical protein [Ruixingdingia sedimenti]|uniref:Uncharacterized protein n=1 Tax=Ruixingdingia sedimenti TaxID=3073604 RepID=A0ABU1F553_9RHOB|nr:hypothetical protein [Xinfangfangia sp. LG-4]MDR5652005.1 hypothetical protein [Xinfangfangia sp. LG-4]